MGNKEGRYILIRGNVDGDPVISGANEVFSKVSGKIYVT